MEDLNSLEFKPTDSTEDTAEKMTTALIASANSGLSLEAKRILSQLVGEQDAGKTKDLTYLFNQNQNKKTMVRIDKMGDLVDSLTNKLSDRITKQPEQFTNKELVDTIKTLSDLMERGQARVMGLDQEAPFIQVNQQNNEINTEASTLDKESRDKVKSAIMNLLKSATAVTPDNTTTININDSNNSFGGNNND